MSSRSRALALAGLTLLLLCLAAYEIVSRSDRSAAADPVDDLAILEAFHDRRSGVMVGSSGTVVRQLADDLEGSRHQRFIVRLADGHTLLISHNIDLAPRVPIEEGDRIEFQGRYEWNDRGGVIHWTHHDPDGRSPGGWLFHDGRRYE